MGFYGYSEGYNNEAIFYQKVCIMDAKNEFSSNYGTVINCIDGEVQIPAIEFLKHTWKVQWVDVITEAAPEKILSEGTDAKSIAHLLDNLKASFANQAEKRVAVAAHAGCTSNGIDEVEKKEMLRKSIGYLNQQIPGIQAVGIWIDSIGHPTSVE